MKLSSWNVARRAGSLSRQVDALASRRPDVVALQEITPKTAILFSGKLPGIGLHHVQDSLALVEEPPLEPLRSSGGVLIASRWPFRVLPPAELGIPWPERALSVKLDSPWGEVELHTVYVPEGYAERKSGNSFLQTETFEGLFR